MAATPAPTTSPTTSPTHELTHERTPEPVPKPGNPIERGLRAIDRWQQGVRPAAFAFGVVKKYGDDRGGQLSSMIAFSAFLSFFPLTLVLVTLTSFVAQRSPDWADRLRTSAVAQFPVVGTELSKGEHTLPGSGLGLLIGVLGLLWGGFGVTQALQFAFHQVWHVPNKLRPPFVKRMLLGLGVFAIIGVGVVSSALLALAGTFVPNSKVVGALGLLAAIIVSAGLYLAVFWLLSPRTVSLMELLPGAAIAATGWQALQLLGIQLVSHQLRRSSELYGSIGAALGLIWFLVLGTQILLYSLEIDVVRKEHLWPRSLLQPPLTGPDKEVLASLAMQEERRPEEQVTVSFAPTQPDRETADSPSTGRDGASRR